MNVTVLNPNESKNLFKTWGEFSSVCYNTPKKFAERVGKSCLTTGHFSGSRTTYIILEIDGCSRALMDQLFRHEQGVAKNMQSGRYVSLEGFDYYTPEPILKNPKAKEIYDKHMEITRENYSAICRELEKDGLVGEAVFECARGIAPMNHHTKCTIGMDVEALINFMNKRLCVCSQAEIRQLAIKIRKLILELIPELKEHLVPICQAQLWCPESEKRTCGAYPQKKELLQLIKNNK